VPLAADPVDSSTYPEFPDPVVPVPTSTDPDTPNDAALAVSSTMDPVPLLALPPARIDTEPPTWLDANVDPPDSTSTPPDPLVPLPTITLIAPPLPPVATPEISAKEPELPDAVVPVLSSREPDAPDEPALAVSSTMDPVPLLALPPDKTVTVPPTLLVAVAEPASIKTAPPVDDRD